MATVLYLSIRAQRLLIVTLYVCLAGCQHADQSDTMVAPQAVQPIPQPYPRSDNAPIASILGSYQANYFQETSTPVNYPVNQQTVAIKLSAVSGDTVNVDIQATANGKYSPGKNVSYPKAVVVSKIFTDGTITYYVYLNQPTNQDCGNFNTIYIYSNLSMDYSFVPPGYQPCTGGRIRLAKS